MLQHVAEGVLVHESAFSQSNAVVVDGAAGALLIDAGVLAEELACLAQDLRSRQSQVVAGFSTHPHWDHLLWHAELGEAPRYGTARCAAVVGALLATEQWRARVAQVMPADLAPRIPLEGFGLITGAAGDVVPSDGPRVRIVEHQAHSAGHAALLVEERGVLVAGDMLSDVLVPMLDLRAADPIADHLAALERLEALADRVDVLIPGHGSVGGAEALRARIAQDRAYVLALRDGDEPDDPRIGPSAAQGWEWVLGVHDQQAQALAQRGSG